MQSNDTALYFELMSSQYPFVRNYKDTASENNNFDSHSDQV
jgi:hypothetical protein